MKKPIKHRGQKQRVTIAKVNLPCIFNPNKARPFDGSFFRVKEGPGVNLFSLDISRVTYVKSIYLYNF